MFPPYFEYLTVRTIISKIAMDADSTIETNSTIRRKIANVFNSNQINQLTPSDVKVYRLKGKTYIDANYEVRLPIVWRVDAVLKFDDLLYQVGDPEPLSKPPTVNK
jgi:D-aminopeptidase